MKYSIQNIFKLAYILFFIWVLQSCITEIDKALDTESITFKPLGSQKFENFKPQIKSYKNQFHYHLKYKYTDNQTNNSDRFLTVFYDSIWPLPLDKHFTAYSPLKELILNNQFIISNLNINNLRTYNHEIEIPAIFFQSLKKGKNDIIIGIYRLSTDTVSRQEKVVDFAYFKSKITIPEIYGTQFICNGIELQNDSIWSPYNMDFSFGKGLPDVFWTLSCPAKDEKDFDNHYSSTSVEWNVLEYSLIDTINIFTLNANENMLIHVTDFDRIFSDDYISHWFGDINDLKSNSKGYITFPNVSKFKYKLTTLGCVNCEENLKKKDK